MLGRTASLVAPLAFAALTAFGTGCGPSWQISKQAMPDPFLGQKKFAVLPVDYSGLQVGEKGEAEYLAEKDAETQGNWAGDKLGLNDRFAEKLAEEARESGLEIVKATGPADAPFMIRPHVAWIEPGYYIGISGGSSNVKMTLQITSPDGKVLDEILIEHGTSGTVTTASTGQRLRSDGAGLGATAAKYLAFRATGKN
jgi:hypothetical protein